MKSKKKIPWEKPKLLDLNDENTIAHGYCGGGSSDQWECGGGVTVTSGPCTAGTAAINYCNGGGGA